MNITRQKVEICWCRKCRLVHFINYFQIFNLIVNDLHRMFFEKSRSMSLQQHELRSFSSRSYDKCNLKNNDRLIQFTLRHISMRRSYLLSKRSNSKSSEFTHARENLPRQFSIPMHVFRFSKISHSTSICRRCQGHFVIYLSSDWFTSIASRVGKISIWEYWSEEITKVICFRIQKF